MGPSCPEQERRELLLRYLALPLSLSLLTPGDVKSLCPLLGEDMDDRLLMERRVGEGGEWNSWMGFYYRYRTTPAVPKGVKRLTLVLCHGFGASSAQMSDFARFISREGYDCAAPDLPGFGRSQKPRILYTQYLWGAFLADFAARRSGGGGVVIAGNSIGGYSALSAAAEYASRGDGGKVKGVVLFNR